MRLFEELTSLALLPRRRLAALPSVLQESGQLVENEVKVQGEHDGGDEAKDLRAAENTQHKILEARRE